MVNKDQINKTVGRLLQSARERNTSQGVVVFEKVLELLDAADSPAEVANILKKLNGVMSGIEAHGDLTQQEFIWVKELRKMEEEMRA